MNALTIVIIVIIIVLVYFLLRYIFSNPYTLQSIQNGQTTTIIAPSALATNSNTSADDTNFAYSIWFYINDWNYRYGEVKTIFARMGDATNGTNPCPSVHLDAIENNVTVTLACFPGAGAPATAGSIAPTSVDHTCTVGNVPVQRWVNLIVSVYGRSMDVYIDGKLVKTCLLPGVANINSNASIYVTPDGGFDGWTSKFQYYPSPLNPQEAWNIYAAGYSAPYANMFGSYQVQVSLLENGNTKSTLTV
jgi:hypothetical protein